jgi:WhiB family redox-sensing transcriptional regulator
VNLQWKDRHLCRETDPELFFASSKPAIRQAQAICGECPVLEACREYAIPDWTLVGVWGGTTTSERKKIRAARREAS